MAKAKSKKITIEDALVPVDEQPYEVPENWCWIHLLDAFDNVTDSKKKLSTKEYQEEGEYSIIDQGQEFVGGYTDCKDMVYDGDMPVIIFGDHTRCVKYVDFPFVQGADGVKVLSPKKFWDSKAFYYAIQNVEIPNMGYRRHYPLFKNFSIPVPPLPEQQRIVEQIESLFSKLDEAKEKAQTSLEYLVVQKNNILHKTFMGNYSKGSDLCDVEKLLSNMISVRERMVKNKEIQRAKVNHVSDKDLIDGFPSCWKQVKLGEIAFVTKLAGFEYTKYINLEESGQVPVIRAQNVREGYLDTTNLLYIESEISELLKRSALTKPSILITFIGAGIGDVCVFDRNERFHLAPNVAKVEPYISDDGEINIYYILYYLLSDHGQREIFKSMKATAQPSLSMETIRDIVIPIPSKEEQDSIVEFLDRYFEKHSEVEATAFTVINNINVMKKSILAKAFRGELGTNNPMEESSTELLKQILK